jgi:hypothetical protein
VTPPRQFLVTFDDDNDGRRLTAEQVKDTIEDALAPESVVAVVVPLPFPWLVQYRQVGQRRWVTKRRAFDTVADAAEYIAEGNHAPVETEWRIVAATPKRLAP